MRSFDEDILQLKLIYMVEALLGGQHVTSSIAAALTRVHACTPRGTHINAQETGREG